MNTTLKTRGRSKFRCYACMGGGVRLHRYVTLSTALVAFFCLFTTYLCAAEDAILNSARTALSEGNYPKAAELAGKYVEKSPDGGAGHLLLAQIQRIQAVFAEDGVEADRYKDRATASLREATRLLGTATLDPGKTDLDFARHLAAAWVAADDRLWAKAAMEYEAASNAKPEDDYPVFGVMMASKEIADNGRWGRAIRRLVASRDPNLTKVANQHSKEFNEQLAKTVTDEMASVRNLLKEGTFDDAEARLRSSVRRSPQAGLLHFELAKLLSQRGNPDEAVLEFREAVRNAYVDSEQFIKAAEAPALLNNKDYIALVSDTFGEGSAQQIRGQWKKMETEVLRQKREKLSGLEKQVRELAQQQKLDDALKLAKSAAAQFPGEPEAGLLVKEIETAIKRDNCDSLLRKTQELLRQKHFAEAQNVANQALALIPNYPDAVKVLNEIPALKRRHADELFTTTRAIYRKQRQLAYANLREVVALFPESAEARSLQDEVDRFFAKVDSLRKRVGSATVGRPDLDTLEAITELRGMVPDDQEVVALWQKHCVLNNSLGMQLIFVPHTQAGGSGVIVERGFFLAQLETTEAQWAKVMPDSRSNLVYGNSSAKVWNKDGTYYHPAQDHPVCQVSLIEALAFVQKLSEQEGRRYRLPTPVEWEYACLAGQSGTELSADALDKVAWFHGNATRNGETYPHKVAQKAPNDWGFYDMLGNVAEWCALGKGNTTNANEFGIVKGGSWNDPPQSVTSNNQTVRNSTSRDRSGGFRVVLEP